MKKQYTRGLSFLMTLCMVFSLFTCLGVGAFADDGELALDAEVVVVEEEVVLEEAAVEEEVVVEEAVPLEAAQGCKHWVDYGGTLSKVSGKEATCKEAGYRDCYKCSKCGDYFENTGTFTTKYEKINNYEQWQKGAGKIEKDADKHSAESKPIEAKAATCVEDGLKATFEHKFGISSKQYDVYSCPDCGAYFVKDGKQVHNLTETEKASLVTEKLGHDLKDVAGLAATCTTDGYEAAKQCKREGCKAYFTTDEKPIENYDEWKTGAGKIEALDHDMKLAGERLDPTCTKAGHLAYYQCNRNGCKLYFYKLSDLAPAPELGLDSATADEYALIGDGSTAALNTWLTEGAGYIKPLGHDMGDPEDDGNGTTHTRACKREGCEYSEPEDHTFEDGECTVCGAEEPVTKVTVKFSGNTFGTVQGLPENQQVAMGGKVTKPASDPTRQDYEFGGWYKEWQCRTAWDFDTDVVDKDTTLYAKWNRLYKVTYNAMGGELEGASTVLLTKLPATLPTATRDGYAFGGWYLDWRLTREAEPGTELNGNVTLYAKWDEIHVCKDNLTPVSAVPATCENSGNKGYYTCECGKNYEDAEAKELIGDDVVLAAWLAKGGKGYIAPLGHDMGECVDNENGTTHTSTCKRAGCGYFVVADHDFGRNGLCVDCGAKKHVCKDNLTPVSAVPATCCTLGCKEYYTCSCGKNFYDKNARYEIQNLALWKATLGLIAIDPDNHATEPKRTEQKDPTCTETGLKAYYYCESCERYFAVNNKGEIGTRIGDENWFDDWCKTDPKTNRLNWGGLLPALGHDLADVKGLDPTCTEAGHLAYYQCEDCELYFSDEEGTVIGDADALDAWLAEGGEGYIAPLGHDTKPVAGLDPTCCEDGFKEAYQCKRCELFLTTEGEVIGDDEDYETWKLDPDGGLIPALGHNIQLAAERLEPTCTEAGHLAYYQCDHEGCKLYFYDMDDLAPAIREQLLQLDSKVLSFGLIGDKADLDKWLAEGGDGYLEPLGHDWSDWEDNGDGTHSRACVNDPTHVETEKHEYKDGKCVDCGANEPKPAPKAPKTGDNGHALLWAALALTMGCGATAVVLKKKHN